MSKRTIPKVEPPMGTASPIPATNGADTTNNLYYTKPTRKVKRRWRYRKPIQIRKPWMVSSLCSWLSAPGSCLYVMACPFCAIAEQRIQIMEEQSKALKDYKCFALMYPGPCFCGGDVCDEESHKPLKRNCTGGCYLCWEVIMCTPCAVRGNRYLLEQRYGMSRENWEVQMDRCPFPYFTLDCCTVPCIPCIMTQQIVQWKYEKRTAVNKLTPKKTEPLPSQTYTTMPNETITSVEEDTDSFQSAVSSSSEDEKRESRLQDETALPTVNVAAPDETPSPFGTSVASMPDRAGSGFLDVADHTDPSPLYPHTRQGRRSSFIKKSFHQIGDGRGHNVCAFMRDNQYVVLDLASEDMPIIAYVSKQFAALTGYDETELVGRTYDVLFGPNTNPVCIAQMRHILRSGNEGFVYFNNNCKDGTPFINIMYLVPFTPPTRQGDQQQTGKFMLGCQSNAGDSIVRLLLADITDPTVNPHPKSNLLLRFDSTTYVPNVGPGKVTSPHFDGCFFLKTLTDPHDPRVASYFEGRRRRFELQIQGEFKTPISGDVYLNLYLPEQLKLGFASRAIVKLMCAGVRKRSKGSVLTFGDEYDIGKPAMALPGSGSFDRLVISNPSAGQVPPIINVDMFPEPVEVVTKYEIGTTYSFSFHSAFLDLEYWCVRGLPGISSVSLSNITGTQTIHVALTTLPPGVAPELIQSQGIHLIDFEVIHKSLPAYASAVSGVPPPLPSDPVPPPSTTDTAPTDSAIVSPAPNTET